MGKESLGQISQRWRDNGIRLRMDFEGGAREYSEITEAFRYYNNLPKDKQEEWSGISGEHGIVHAYRLFRKTDEIYCDLDDIDKARWSKVAGEVGVVDTWISHELDTFDLLEHRVDVRIEQRRIDNLKKLESQKSAEIIEAGEIFEASGRNFDQVTGD